MNRTLPIISLEFSSMQFMLKTALSEHILAVDRNVQEAIENYCTEDNLKKVIEGEVKSCLDDAVKEEVRAFFSHSGAGRKAVKEAVLEYLTLWEQSHNTLEELK